MSNSAKKKKAKSDVFGKELSFLERAKRLLQAEGEVVTQEELKSEYSFLCQKYERLINEAKLLTSISDRLHAKLNIANEKLKRQSEEIKDINEDLKVKNQVLKDTIDELVKARISRKASAIVLLIAVLLFIVSEVLLEPRVEASVDNIYVGLLFKLVIALLLKPIDVIVERYLLRRNIRHKTA